MVLSMVDESGADGVMVTVVAILDVGVVATLVVTDGSGNSSGGVGKGRWWGCGGGGIDDNNSNVGRKFCQKTFIYLFLNQNVRNQY